MLTRRCASPATTRPRRRPRTNTRAIQTSRPSNNAQVQVQLHPSPLHAPALPPYYTESSTSGSLPPLETTNDKPKRFSAPVLFGPRSVTHLPTPIQLMRSQWTSKRGNELKQLDSQIEKVIAAEAKSNSSFQRHSNGDSEDLGWWFPAAQGFAQERLSVMRACLEGGWDVERAKAIFEKIRRENE